jgi:hypothetical protein
MGIKQAIRSLVLGESTISDLIGTKLYATIAETRAQLPYIAYERTSSESMSVTLGAVGDLRKDRFAFQVNTNTSLEGDNIAEALRVFLESQYLVSPEGVPISRFYFSSQSEGEYLPEGREKPIYEVVQNWEVVYNAS